MNNIQQAPAEHLTDLVKLLTETPGPSGAEHRIRAAVIDQISGLADEVRTDANRTAAGNAAAASSSQGRIIFPRVDTASSSTEPTSVPQKGCSVNVSI